MKIKKWIQNAQNTYYDMDLLNRFIKVMPKCIKRWWFKHIGATFEDPDAVIKILDDKDNFSNCRSILDIAAVLTDIKSTHTWNRVVGDNADSYEYEVEYTTGDHHKYLYDDRINPTVIYPAYADTEGVASFTWDYKKIRV